MPTLGECMMHGYSPEVLMHHIDQRHNTLKHFAAIISMIKQSLRIYSIDPNVGAIGIMILHKL